jgi:mRNA interferase MazF
MRAIHVAQFDKDRPVLVLTRELVRPQGIDAANGLTEPSVVSCDNITTIPTDALGAQIGVLLDSRETTLSEAIMAAFDLD